MLSENAILTVACCTGLPLLVLLIALVIAHFKIKEVVDVRQSTHQRR